MSQTQTAIVSIELESRSYDILIGNDLLRAPSSYEGLPARPTP